MTLNVEVLIRFFLTQILRFQKIFSVDFQSLVEWKNSRFFEKCYDISIYLKLSCESFLGTFSTVCNTYKKTRERPQSRRSSGLMRLLLYFSCKVAEYRRACLESQELLMLVVTWNLNDNLLDFEPLRYAQATESY